MTGTVTRNIVLFACLAAVPSVARSSDEGAALYKSKCAACHGAGGEGKPAVKAPALKGIAWDSDRIVQHITKGEANSKAPHNKAIAGLSVTQAKAIAEFIKTLK
jgi:mono/diheme cytochrome c family protein